MFQFARFAGPSRRRAVTGDDQSVFVEASSHLAWQTPRSGRLIFHGQNVDRLD
jgi:hypothetical protein